MQVLVPNESTITIETDEIVRVMVTNALSLMRVVESLESNVIEGGTTGAAEMFDHPVCFSQVG
jgi:hypothetical protein